MTDPIFAPFFSMILLTLVIWVYMYARRIPFIRRSGLRDDQLTPAGLASNSPPGVANPSDNLKNLFETPTIFYALVLYLHVTQSVDAAYLGAAWVFVGFRALHSVVHCTFNVIILRFTLYAISTLALWFIAVRAAIQAFA